MSNLSLDSRTLAKIPILNSNKPTVAPTDPRTLRPMTQEAYNKGVAKLSSEAVTKPDRQLGGCYLSDTVETLGSVVLCDPCINRYWFGRGGLKSKGTHRPSWGHYFISACDGCGKEHLLVILFLPESQFSEVLGGLHGTVASPRQPIFSRFYKSRQLRSKS